MRKGKIKISLALFLGLWAALPLFAQKQDRKTASGGEEFFIISSVDMAKHQLVLKHPTEVTELMMVNDKTSCVNEKGKSFGCESLRAGDTVFVTSNRNGEGGRVALRIRIGPMTIDEIHRKYANFQ